MYVTTIAVPWQVYMVPQFILVSKMGLNDTHIGLMLMQAFSAFGVFLMRQFYISIPDELCEAARIDGMNEFGIFSKIIFPLGKPGMATLTIFTFTNVSKRLHGTVDLLKDPGIKDRSAWYPYVYFSVRRRLCMDHGSICMFPDSGCNCILKLSALLR